MEERAEVERAGGGGRGALARGPRAQGLRGGGSPMSRRERPLVAADGLYCPACGAPMVAQTNADEPDLYYCAREGRIFRIVGVDDVDDE